MLSRRIIPCLDVKNGEVVKGVQFRDHKILGGIVELAQRYRDQGADELVFYDITASAEGRLVDASWVRRVAQGLDIPFCVAGGIRSVSDARSILNAGADKISINSPALERPELIEELATAFGQQCVVIGVDSHRDDDGQLRTWQYTGQEDTARQSGRLTLDWVKEVEERGAGEIVLNAMNQDGVGKGYDIEQMQSVRNIVGIPLIASGGAGRLEHFSAVFEQAQVDGALAAGVFHRGEMTVGDVKTYLRAQGVEVRL